MANLNDQISGYMHKWKIRPDQILVHTRFLLFVFMLIIVKIAIGFFTNDKIVKIQQMEKEVRDLRWQCISIESSLLSEAKESQISERVASLKLEVSKDVPKTIVIP